MGRVNVALLWGLPTALLLWASKKMDVFRSRSVPRGQGRSQMPRLLLGPQRSAPLRSGHLGTLPGISVTKWILHWALAQSGKELEWEGNREFRVLLFLIPMRLFFLPCFKGNSFLGTHSTASYTHAPLDAGEASSRIIPLWAVTATIVYLWALQETQCGELRLTWVTCSRSPSQPERGRAGCKATSAPWLWLCSLDPFLCQIRICL